MIQDAHRRRFDAILVWKMDRLGRSLKHLVTTIEDLAAYGATFVSLRDNLDLSTPAGRLMMHVIGAMAEFERELINETCAKHRIRSIVIILRSNHEQNLPCAVVALQCHLCGQPYEFAGIFGGPRVKLSADRRELSLAITEVRKGMVQ
jgi:Resolvase, N terminal domain